MIRNYNLKHRLVAYVCLLSLLLQSCGPFSKNIEPEEKKPADNTPRSSTLKEITWQIIEQKFTSVGWELIDFYGKDDSKIKAVEKHGNFTSMPQELSVHIAKTIDLEEVSRLSLEGQNELIHFNPPQNGRSGRVIISKGGLSGGMRMNRGNNVSEKQEKGKEKEEPVTALSPIENIPWSTQTYCLWQLGQKSYQKVALDLLIEQAKSEQPQAIISYFKKLGKFGSISFFLSEAGNKFLPAELNCIALGSDEKLRKGIIEHLSSLYEKLLALQKRKTSEDKFRCLKAKYYYYKLLEPEDNLKTTLLEEINAGLEELFYSSTSNLLKLKRRHLKYLISKENVYNLRSPEEIIEVAEGIAELAKETRKSANHSKITEEVQELRKFAATLYRKAASLFHRYSTIVGLEETISKQRDYYLAAKSLGDPIGAYRLGVLYSTTGSYYNLEEAKDAFEDAADKEYPLAEYKIANLAEVKNINESYILNWHHRAAKQGHPDSLFKLFQYFYKREGFSQEQAISYLKKAVQLKQFEAQKSLASLYWEGEGVEQNYEKALELYQDIAAQGSLEAQYFVGLAAEKGLGRDIDYQVTHELYNQITEKLGEQMNIQFRRARMYEKGKGVETDEEKALELYKHVMQENIKATYYAGRLGLKKGIEKEAYEWIITATKFSLPKAFLLLGIMKQYGWGIDQDSESALNFYNQTVAHPQVRSSTKAIALYQLAKMTKRGIGTVVDKQQALALFQQAADCGHKEALFQVGKLLIKQKDYKQAQQALEKETLVGHTQAQMLLGTLYKQLSHGDNFYKSKAQQAFRRAALRNHALAQYRLAQVLEADGNQEAIYWYEKAAEVHKAALKALSLLYEQGRLVEKDLDKSLVLRLAYETDKPHVGLNLQLMRLIKGGCNQALDRLQKQSDSNDTYAQNKLASLLTEGRFILSNLTAGIQYYGASYQGGNTSSLKSIYELACLGLPEALRWMESNTSSQAEFYRGRMYEEGTGVRKNIEEAEHLYILAAEQGNVDAKYRLGLLYHNGDKVVRDHSKALVWYTKAAEQGHEEAQYKLGNIYYYGENIPKDYNEALAWFNKAAEQQHKKAQYSLGHMYYYGEGVSKDYTKALAWFNKAAEQGHREAQYSFAVMYYCGEGTTKDHTKAITWFNEAAEQGHEAAQYSLGYMYLRGEGITKNYTKALAWFNKVAEQGHKGAQFSLGEMYYYGEGTTKNYTKALAWYQKAADQGHEAAKSKIREMYKYGQVATPKAESTTENSYAQNTGLGLFHYEFNYY